MSARPRRLRATPDAKKAPRAATRDMAASSFAPILADLVARVPGAMGAVMVDGEGEAVDYAGSLDPFDLKLAGAHWQIVLSELVRMLAGEAGSGASGAPALGRARSLIVRGANRSFVAHALPDDYALVLVLSRRAGFTATARAFAVCERALAREAGWRIRARTAWFPLEVVSTRAGRPARLRDARTPPDAPREHPVEILGQLAKAALSPRERGWRVRLENGAELTLIREPGDHWYGDEPLEALIPDRALTNG